MITVTLFALAVINVLTKKTATIAGVIFTIAFFIVFEVSDLYHRKLKAAQGVRDAGPIPGALRNTGAPQTRDVRRQIADRRGLAESNPA